MIIGRGISKSFGQASVLRDVDVEVHPGEITVIIGPSGSGKSTMLRALSLLEPPDAGSITIDDRVFEFPLRNGTVPNPPWPYVTVVFQQLFLWPHLTLRQNIDLPATENGRAEYREDIQELVEEFELEPFIGRYPNEVSLGQRQRAALVRAIALKPRYLLLDEITSALDIEHVSKVLNRLERLQTENTGILVITHLIGFARRSADRVIFLENGQVLASGGPSLLVSPENERLRKFLSLVESAI